MEPNQYIWASFLRNRSPLTPTDKTTNIEEFLSHTYLAYKEMLGWKEMKDSPISHTHLHTATIFFSCATKQNFFQVLEEVSSVRLWGLHSNMQCMYRKQFYVNISFSWISTVAEYCCIHTPFTQQPNTKNILNKKKNIQKIK